MDDDFEQLRACIYNSPSELCRFRQLVVNGVLATDASDPELNAWRNEQWERSLGAGESVQSGRDMKDDRRAMLVFELILQAADVSHCMQHWLIFSKWSSRSFEERLVAFLSGRKDFNNDPIVNWYENELEWFDSYIIPLAKRLQSCGLFGASGDEFWHWAEENRQEFACTGPSFTETVHQALCKKYASATAASTSSGRNLWRFL